MPVFKSRSPRMPEPSLPASIENSWIDTLQATFAVRFSVWDGRTGLLLSEGDHPALRDTALVGELVRAVARSGQPELIAETDGAAILAIPLDSTHVAVSAVATIHGESDNDQLASLADLMEDSPATRAWLDDQTRWQPGHILRSAAAAMARVQPDLDLLRLQEEVESLTQNLAATYEEISLLYSVSQQLRISSTEEEMARLALRQLRDCVPAKLLAIQFLPQGEENEAEFEKRERSHFVHFGDDPLDQDSFTNLVERLGLEVSDQPFVANPPLTDSDSWAFPMVRELVLVPLAENGKRFGWLAAINHQDGGEFGTVEANLIASVAAMLSIHGSNRMLYREQAEFVANVVRALVSAIDAKDPYTSGHSDRVARFAVRVALELRRDAKFLNTIYMAGLLHDVGKIGIEDSILRKAGQLSAAEFEHIKLHPELGCKILADLKQLADVLPAVRHHHESWNGAGYPQGLAGKEIPEIARIMSVADAYDAMTSNRPYRQGLSEEKVDEILREGAGVQWDPRVIEAFFAAKEDIMAIANRSRPPLDAAEKQWT